VAISFRFAGQAPPHDRAELQGLRRDARRVVHSVLGPADDLTLVVGAGREAVRAAERRQRPHHAVFPYEAETLVAGSES